MHHLFLDESGNHSLTAFEPAYPVFVLGGVIIADADLEAVDEAVRAFKRDALGDECVALHTADISRNRRGFETLADGARRSRFHRELNELMRSLPFAVVACAIDKPALVRRYGGLAVDPYSLSLGIIVERFCFALGEAEETGQTTAGSRSRGLDRNLVMAWAGPAPDSSGYPKRKAGDLYAVPDHDQCRRVPAGWQSVDATVAWLQGTFRHSRSPDCHSARRPRALLPSIQVHGRAIRGLHRSNGDLSCDASCLRPSKDKR
jgi:hypothetical protein